MNFNMKEWLTPQIELDKAERVERLKNKTNKGITIITSVGPSKKRHKLSSNSMNIPNRQYESLMTQYRLRRRVKNRMERNSRRINRG